MEKVPGKKWWRSIFAAGALCASVVGGVAAFNKDLGSIVRTIERLIGYGAGSLELAFGDATKEEISIIATNRGSTPGIVTRTAYLIVLNGSPKGTDPTLLAVRLDIKPADDVSASIVRANEIKVLRYGRSSDEEPKVLPHEFGAITCEVRMWVTGMDTKIMQKDIIAPCADVRDWIY